VYPYASEEPRPLTGANDVIIAIKGCISRVTFEEDLRCSQLERSWNGSVDHPRPIRSCEMCFLAYPSNKNDGAKVKWEYDIPNMMGKIEHVPNHQPGS